MSNDTNIQSDNTHAIARGKRLRSLRMMLGLPRKALQQAIDISASTLQSWENAKVGGLTEKGARRIVPLLRQQGLQCDVEWLLYGVGASPQLMDNAFLKVKETPAIYSIDEGKAIAAELSLFEQHLPDVMHVVVTNDAMFPHYRIDDNIAGRARFGDDIAELVGNDCIVETSDHSVFFRRLQLGSKPRLYTLLSINPDTTVQIPAVVNCDVLRVAAVIWHRRKDLSST